MLINYSDYNRSEELFTLKNNSVNIWEELYFCLKNMPLYLKQSDQKGKQGEAIFDPVGTNEHIKRKLESTEGWQPNFPIPDRYRHLGTDIDFIKKGILVEVQFSNYPFLTNNLLRSEIIF
jgi:Restriction endonuclease BglII.